MKLFLNYLRQYRAVLIFFILSGAVFSVSFVFYRLPVEAVLYPFALCALFGAAALIFGFFRKRKRLSRLCAVTAAKETVAETNAMNSQTPVPLEVLAMRTQVLQNYFPRTIAVATKLTTPIAIAEKGVSFN